MQARQCVELFHLLFLDQLGRKTDKQGWALKGGCNLRFFFHSIRYSEDMDLDVGDVPAHLLRERVNAILSSRPFRDILSVKGLEIEHATEAKQTATTQRWKLGLRSPVAESPLPTKIEFSRRAAAGETVFGPIAAELTREHELTPIWANHYDARSACSQKLGALVGRSVVQARDVFDLHVLLPRLDPTCSPELPDGMDLRGIEERVLSVDFGVFKSQVISYLPPDLQARYDAPETWETIVLETVERLRGMLA